MADILTPEEQTRQIANFLRRQVMQPTFWGVSDCCMMPADWVMEALSIPDPAAEFRGTYDSEESANAIVVAYGGIQNIFAGVAASIGLPETVMPVDGDIGIVMMPGGATGAVMSRGSWAFRTPRGLVWSQILPWRIAKAWTVFPLSPGGE